MADSKLTLVIEADAKGAISVIKQVGDASKELTTANEKTKTSFVELNQALELVEKGFAFVASAASTAIQALDRGDAIIGVTAGFDNLSKSAGVVSETFRNDLSEAATGLVTDFDLMRLANSALIKGIDPKSFVELTDAAVNLGESLNVEATQAIETATTALGNMTAKGLMALGVSKDLVIGIQAQVDATEDAAKAEKFRTLALDALTKTSEKFGRSQRTAGDALTTLKNSLANIKDEFAKGISGSTELAEALDKLAKRMGENKSIWESLGKIASDVLGTGIKVVESAADALRTKLEELEESLIAASFQNTADELEKLNTGLGTTYLGLLKFHEQVENQSDLDSFNTAVHDFSVFAIEAGMQGELWEGVVSDLERAFIDAQVALDKLNASKPTDLGTIGPENPGLWGQIENGFGQMLSGAGSDIAAAGGPIALIAKKVGDAIGTAIAVGIEQGTKQGFEAFGGSLLQDSGPLGQLVGEKLGAQVYEGIEHVFGIGGSNNAAHKARNSINQFFHDALEEVTINTEVGGILQRLTDINFDESALRAGGWADALNSASTQVQDGFKGIGLALQENLGISEDIAGQISAALYDGVGGSLNDLQLLIQGTGLSLEDLKAGIVDAFKSGEVTALDALNALRGVENVLTPGIPDGIGMVAEAFENLKKGGGNSLDALGDLAIELQEKQLPGVTATLEDLRKELLAQNKPIEEVDALMSALARNGVDSLDDLLNASEELGVSIIADLQQSTTAFGESLSKTAEDIKSLTEDLNKLEGKTFDTYVKVHVEQVGDSLPGGVNLGEAS